MTGQGQAAHSRKRLPFFSEIFPASGNGTPRPTQSREAEGGPARPQRKRLRMRKEAEPPQPIRLFVRQGKRGLYRRTLT